MELFGTDGIRGSTGAFPFVPDFLTQLGETIGYWIRHKRGISRPCVVIGRDTRESADTIFGALTSGLMSVGVNVYCAGILPTPAVAFLVQEFEADLGIVISASHNPASDNGIKLFDHLGEKLPIDAEDEIEKEFLKEARPPIKEATWGRLYRRDDGADAYVNFVKQTYSRSALGEADLHGLRLVVDCAHGANYRIGIRVFEELGTTVIPLGVTPDGRNINHNCGALEPTLMQQTMRENRAHLGIAFDGDGDRLVLADEEGSLINGDQILALFASMWHPAERLQGQAVVGTVMSNLGLEHYLNTQGLSLIRAQVGDRSVVNAMYKNGCNLGGEPSGHIVLRDWHTSSDALITALLVLGILTSKKIPASSLFPLFTPVPQVLKNVCVSSQNILLENRVRTFLEDTSQRLGSSGRLLVRPSGTEPVIRVMAEGEDSCFITDLVQEVSSFLEKYRSIAA